MTKRELAHYCYSRIGIEYALLTKEYGIIPPDYWLDIPCGTCFACLKRKRLEWSFRLIQEVLQYKESTFITLTFDEKHLEKFKDDYKRPLMLYLDRLRKRIGYRPRYWFISEKGDEINHTGRVHFHGIIFGTSQKELPFKVMRDCWKYGRSDTGYVNVKTANYLTKYMLKFQGDYKYILMCSNGIGSSYLKKYSREWFVNNFDFRNYVIYNNRKYPLSAYYRSKVYDDDIRLVKMLNRYLEHKPFESWLNGTKYISKYQFEISRKDWFSRTMRIGLSKPLKQKFDYGKICISQSGFAENWQV